jgi:hypothetical protein
MTTVRCVWLGAALLALSVMLFYAPFFRGRFAFRSWHFVSSCSDVVCDIVAAANASLPPATGLVVYPRANASTCAFVCRDRGERVHACAAAGDVDRRAVWIVWHGDSIARRTYIDMVEMLGGRRLVHIDDIDSLCRRKATVNDRRKCVLYDHVIGVSARRLLRITFVARHRVGETFDWADLRHFEGVSWTPALLIVNSGLWDLLYERNFTDYQRNLPLAIEHARSSAAATIVWMAIPKLDYDHLPAWKQPFLGDAAIQEYNAYTLAVLTKADEPRMRWLDAYALTDERRADSFGRLPALSAAERLSLYETEDGIHRPGPLSRTLSQLQLELTCGRAL